MPEHAGVYKCNRNFDSSLTLIVLKNTNNHNNNTNTLWTDEVLISSTVVTPHYFDMGHSNKGIGKSHHHHHHKKDRLLDHEIGFTQKSDDFQHTIVVLDDNDEVNGGGGGNDVSKKYKNNHMKILVDEGQELFDSISSIIITEAPYLTSLTTALVSSPSDSSTTIHSKERFDEIDIETVNDLNGVKDNINVIKLNKMQKGEEIVIIFLKRTTQYHNRTLFINYYHIAVS